MNASIFLPSTAPEAYADRLSLWNAAEAAEVRKNARVAREVILALPHELPEEARISLTRDMALFLVEKYGVAVDMAVHAPMPEHSDDPRNHHAHLLFTTRVVKQDGLGEKTRILDDKEQGPQQIELIRQVWETLANAALQQAGFGAVKIDRRTLEAQGIDRIPQEHVGKAGTHGEAADDTEEPRKKYDEDEDGETDTGQSKAGSGDSKGQSPSAAKKEPSPASRKKDPVPPRAQTRLGLNEEIKRLNEQRSLQSPVPLKVQIKDLDRLMDRLDGRVQRLKTLSDKTSLPERIKTAITSLYTRAMTFLAVRTKDEAQRNFSDAEREAKAERQRGRYGRTYRASINERMTQMRENIQILETRQKQHQKYAAFVSLIERRVEAVRAEIKPPALPARTEWKTITALAVQAKTFLEAKKARTLVPAEYRPNLKQEPLIIAFKVALTNTASPIAMNKSLTQAAATVLKTYSVVKLEGQFSLAAPPPVDNKDRAIWFKEAKISIKSLDLIRAERTPIQSKEPMDSPNVWRIEPSERGKAVLFKIQADIRERKVLEPLLNRSGFSGAFNQPVKIVTEFEVLQKVKVEANIARAKVPADMRAAPYGEKDPTEPKLKFGFSGKFNSFGKSAAVDMSIKMSAKFNLISKKDSAPEQPKPYHIKSEM